MTDGQKRVLQFGLKSQKFGACTVYNIAGSIVEFQGGTVQCKNDFLKLLHIVPILQRLNLADFLIF